jgi:hypothetical protein
LGGLGAPVLRTLNRSLPIPLTGLLGNRIPSQLFALPDNNLLWLEFTLLNGILNEMLVAIEPLLPSIPQEAVIIAFGLEASIRCASDGGEKPLNTTACIAPRRAIASIAKRAAGIMGTV